MNIKKQIPNLLTLLNLLCGCIAIVFVSELKFDLAFYFVSLGIFFDFFDGFLARKFGVSGPLGVQLDSLADMVTSGVVPGFVVFKLLSDSDMFGTQSVFPFIAFIITLGACYRLANFNIDTRQSDSFIGLPTPANTLFFMSLPLINSSFYDDNFFGVVYDQCFLVVLVFISAYLMNAEILLFSLKIKDFSFQKYKLQIGFLSVAFIMVIMLQILAIPLIIVMYVLISLVNNMLKKK